MLEYIEIMQEHANKIADDRIRKLKELSYNELLSLVSQKPDTEALEQSGHEYQIDIRCFMEEKNSDVICVRVAVFVANENYPWWQFWRNIDRAVASESFVKRP